jgi:hypothetical protein
MTCNFLRKTRGQPWHGEMAGAARLLLHSHLPLLFALPILSPTTQAGIHKKQRLPAHNLPLHSVCKYCKSLGEQVGPPTNRRSLSAFPCLVAESLTATPHRPSGWLINVKPAPPNKIGKSAPPALRLPLKFAGPPRLPQTVNRCPHCSNATPSNAAAAQLFLAKPLPLD